MKKCNHCNAAIQDDAKFCLNCMTSLKQKKSAKVKPFAVNKKVLLTAAGILLCGLTAVSVGLFFYTKDAKGADDNGTITTIIERFFTEGSQNSSNSGTSNGSDSVTREDDQQNTNVNQSQDDNSHQNSDGTDQDTKTPDSSNYNPNGYISQNFNDDSSGGGSSGGGSSGGGSSGGNSSGGNSSGGGSSSGTTSNNTVPTEQVRYSYRALTRHDLEYRIEFYPSSYPSDYCDNKIVLTDVLDTSDNWVYIIPEKIDGYEVHTISGYLFASRNPSKVKCVVLPKTVKTITHRAFAFCTNLENVYCLSTYLDCAKYAFCDELFLAPASDKITIYCLDNCLAPTYNVPVYFKDIHYLGDITIKVWDGVLPDNF